MLRRLLARSGADGAGRRPRFVLGWPGHAGALAAGNGESPLAGAAGWSSSSLGYPEQSPLTPTLSPDYRGRGRNPRRLTPALGHPAPIVQGAVGELKKRGYPTRE